MNVILKGKGLRILDFDVECRPLAWFGGEWVTKQPTVIAWKFIGEKGAVQVRAIGESDRSSKVLDEEVEMLTAFVEAFDAADVVTGHYIRGFDLPLVNGALMRLGLPLLNNKMAHDTKTDLSKKGGLSSSQENLGAMFELAHPKVQMNTALWARANMLLPDGIADAKARCKGDVLQHIELRQRMLDRDVLHPPMLWSGSAVSTPAPGYTA